MIGWVKGIGGVLCALVGLVWIGQGIGLIPNSFMSGKIEYAILGLVVLIIGGWLLWSLVRARRAVSSTRS